MLGGGVGSLRSNFCASAMTLLAVRRTSKKLEELRLSKSRLGDDRSDNYLICRYTDVTVQITPKTGKSYTFHTPTI